LEKEFEKVEGVVRAKRRRYIPVVLPREEVDRIVAWLDAPYVLVAKLLYGCGLRLFECLKLRVQDLNFAMQVLTVHDGKGQKDRTVPLPRALVPELHEHNWIGSHRYMRRTWPPVTRGPSCPTRSGTNTHARPRRREGSGCFRPWR